VEPGPPEPEVAEPGSGEGVVGGVPGGTAPAAAEEPAYAAEGYRKPRTAEPGCVQRSIRVPEELMDRLGVVTVKFAIDRDGTPSRFQSVSHGLADRVAPGIWRAVQGCRWLPGADARGRPVAIWVILPIRFTVE
jgi:protein TonB